MMDEIELDYCRGRASCEFPTGVVLVIKCNIRDIKSKGANIRFDFDMCLRAFPEKTL